MSSTSISILAGPRLRNGILTVLGVIKAGDLIRFHTIPHYEFDVNKGYQRQAVDSRVKLLVRMLKSGSVDLPTTLLLNRRNLTEKQLTQDGTISSLPLPSSAKDTFYIVDGQHRVLALSKLLEKAHKDDTHRWQQFEIPFVCMVGADEFQEMEQFYIVNANAKSVPTDLSFALLKKRVAKDRELKDQLEKQKKLWQLEAQEIIKQLAQSALWQGRIRFPNMPKEQTLITYTAFIRSLNRPLDQENFGGRTLSDQLTILEVYWKAIEKILPEAFEKGGTYLIQAHVGVVTMNSLLSHVIEIVNKQKASLFDVRSYQAVMKQCLQNLADENYYGERVSGVNFWRSGKAGAASVYSNYVGLPQLYRKIKDLLGR